MTMTTTASAKSATGSLNGMAAQVSLPSISPARLLHRRAPGRAGGPLGTGCRLVDDALEEFGVDRAIGHRRHRLARLCQFGVTGIIQRRPGTARRGDPAFKIAGRHCLGDEP